MANKEWATHDFDVYLSNFLKAKNIEIDRDNKLLEALYESFMKEISPNLTLKKKNQI